MRFLGKAEFGASTFCASCYGNEQCGPNGLPLTPNSIRILGRFQKLKTIEHPRLCKYLDLVRGKHERVIVVSEHYKDNLSKKIADKEFNGSSIIQTAFKILAGLSHLNKEGFVHRCLSPSCILFDPMDQVKISNFGLYHMTGHGMDVSFPIGVVKYLAPEVVCQEMSSETSSSLEGSTTSIGSDSYMSKHSSSPKVDVWSLGIILLELVLKQQIWQRLSVREIFSRIIGFVQKSDVHPFDSIVKEHNGEQTIASIPSEIKMLIQMCLTVMPSARPVPKDLLQHQIFSSARCSEADGALCNGSSNGFKIFSTEVQCRNLQLSSTDDAGYFDDETFDPLSERSIDEVYYLWKLAGGDVESLLRKAGRFLRRPPITTISSFVLDDGEQFGVVRDSSTLLDSTVLILSQDQLRQRLKDIEPSAYYPLLEDETTAGANTGLTSSVSSADLVDCVKLPLVIRERDIEYQFHRIILFERLLKAYPYKRQQILKECRIDIPPLFRAHLWAAILDIEGDVQGLYEAIDKESPIPTDRQIEVDIPRCHQYSELLSSPTGHMKFKRLLKAWVVSHPEYVYWQGLDSLCAPFLYLSFNEEAIAFACLSAFIPKYLHNFFLKDNACVIQEYLAVFSHLIAFHDPVLCNHLDSIGFIPDLYSIPWFLTMYAHVFPLHKIFHLWDTLLLGNSSFPLCIGVAILQQLRDQLLSYGFNECILLFSDMPEIDIEKCVQESIKIFCSTPKSATYRQHAISVKQPSSKQPKPVFSYYSQDYHEAPKTHLSMEPIPVEELKSEKFPRISAEDLIELSELMGPTAGLSPTKRAKSAKPVIVVADVRSEDEFKRGAIPRSVNIPFNSAFGPEGELNPCPAVSFLNQNRNSIKVVVGGSRGKNASNFADALVRFGYSKVCLLHKGIDVLRSAGVLGIPTPEL